MHMESVCLGGWFTSWFPASIIDILLEMLFPGQESVRYAITEWFDIIAECCISEESMGKRPNIRISHEAFNKLFQD